MGGEMVTLLVSEETKGMLGSRLSYQAYVDTENGKMGQGEPLDVTDCLINGELRVDKQVLEEFEKKFEAVRGVQFEVVLLGSTHPGPHWSGSG